MRSIVYLLSCAALLSFTGCDPARVYDENKAIGADAWYYKDNMPFDVQIQDTMELYNVYINLRVGSDYRYNNIFLWLDTRNPDAGNDQRRVEIKLADAHGKWLGSGLGDLYDYQFPVLRKVKFPKSGFYRFTVSQNMRDDTLRFVKSVGIRVEKAESTQP